MIVNETQPTNLKAPHYTPEDDAKILEAAQGVARTLTHSNILESFPNRSMDAVLQRWYKLLKKANGGQPRQYKPRVKPDAEIIDAEPTRMKVEIEKPTAPNSPADDGSNRVEWTEEEQEALAIGLLNLRINQPRENLTDLVRAVQHTVLDRHRWRDFSTITQLGAVLSKFRRKYYDFIGRATTEPEPEFIEIITPPPAPNLAEIIKTIPAEMLVAETMSRMITAFGEMKHAVENMPAPTNGTTPHLHHLRKPVLPDTKKERVVRIAIAGLLNQQAQEVERQCHHLKVKLTFRLSENSRPEFALSAEWIIVQRHAGHHWTSAAKTQVGHKRVIFSDGGVSKIVDHINEICRKEGVA